jgi:hypothetical protein
MKYLPTEARCVFVDGPVAVYVHDAPGVLEAFDRLRKLVEVADTQLSKKAGLCLLRVSDVGEGAEKQHFVQVDIQTVNDLEKRPPDDTIFYNGCRVWAYTSNGGRHWTVL